MSEPQHLKPVGATPQPLSTEDHLARIQQALVHARAEIDNIDRLVARLQQAVLELKMRERKRDEQRDVED